MTGEGRIEKMCKVVKFVEIFVCVCMYNFNSGYKPLLL